MSKTGKGFKPNLTADEMLSKDIAAALVTCFDTALANLALLYLS